MAGSLLGWNVPTLLRGGHISCGLDYVGFQCLHRDLHHVVPSLDFVWRQQHALQGLQGVRRHKTFLDMGLNGLGWPCIVLLSRHRPSDSYCITFRVNYMGQGWAGDRRRAAELLSWITRQITTTKD